MVESSTVPANDGDRIGSRSHRELQGELEIGVVLVGGIRDELRSLVPSPVSGVFADRVSITHDEIDRRSGFVRKRGTGIGGDANVRRGEVGEKALVDVVAAGEYKCQHLGRITKSTYTRSRA